MRCRPAGSNLLSEDTSVSGESGVLQSGLISLRSSDLPIVEISGREVPHRARMPAARLP